MAKASDNVFPRVIQGMNTTDQAAPSDSSWRVYAKANGIFARSSNSIVGPFSTGAGGGVATDTIWDAAGDLVQGTGADTAAKLTLGASGKVLTSTGSAAAWAAGTAILLTYDLAADVTNQAITGGTFFDVFANQNFTVASATSIIQVAVRGYGFMADVGTDQYLCRANIDSGGTPVLRYLTGSSNNAAGTQARDNVLKGGTFFLSGLATGVHTIKIQVTSIVANHFYCRASTNGPTTGGEFLAVQVTEHL